MYASCRVLSAYCKPVDILIVHGVDRTEDLFLLIPDEIRLESDGRFHGNERDELHDMVLYNVSHYAGLLIKGASLLDPDILGNSDLDVVDVPAVPELFEYGVRKAEEDDILHRLFAEVMVDAVNLALIKGPGKQSIQFYS